MRDPNAYGNILETVLEDGELNVEVTYDDVWRLARTYDRYVEEAEEAFA